MILQVNHYILMFPKTIAYVKGDDDGQTKWIYFLIEDNDVLKKCNTTWDTVSAVITKESDSKTVYDKNFLKAKIKSYSDVVTDF